MSKFNFQVIQTGDTNLDRIQRNISNALNTVVGPFIGGVILSSLAVKSATATAFNHGLGRVPQVWVITDQNTVTTVKRTAWDTNTITLQSGSDCTISVWVN